MQHNPTRWISGQEYFIAKNRWNTFWHDEGYEMPPRKFNHFLGLNRGPFSSIGFYQVRGSAASKIEKLAGPHYKVLLKAYKLRKYPKK